MSRHAGAPERTGRAALIGAALLLLGGCTRVGVPAAARAAPAPPAPSTTASGSIPDAASRPAEPPSRSGNMAEYLLAGHRYRVLDSSRGYEEEGLASWYGEAFHGRPTSSGEPFDMYRMSAAHRTLPLPTWVEVVNLDNGRRIVVRVNDRGPFHEPDRRIIDLSYAAARELGMLADGTARVLVRAVEPWQSRTGS